MKSSENSRGVLPGFGETLRAFGTREFGSMKNFAENLGITAQNLNGYLKETRNPGQVFLARLSELGFDVASIFPDDSRKAVSTIREPTQLFSPSSLPPIHLAPSINSFLVAMGLSEAMAARLFQVTPATISSWLDGAAQPDYPQLALMFSQIAPIAMACRAAHPGLEGDKPKNEAAA